MNINYSKLYNNNSIQHVESNTIMSTRSQAQNIPFFYKIVGEQNKKYSEKNNTKNQISKKNKENYKK